MKCIAVLECIMPIYEYQCSACAHEFEAFQNISDAPLKKCPVCHKNKLEKLISATSFQLKGEGWYVTDFRDKNKKPKADAETSTQQTEVSKDAKTTNDGDKTEKKKKPNPEKDTVKSSEKSSKT